MADRERLLLIKDLGRPSTSQSACRVRRATQPAGGLLMRLMRSRRAWIGLLRPNPNGHASSDPRGSRPAAPAPESADFRPRQGRAVNRHRPNKQKTRPAGWIQVGAGTTRGRPSLLARVLAVDVSALRSLRRRLLLLHQHPSIRPFNAHDGCVCVCV